MFCESEVHRGALDCGGSITHITDGEIFPIDKSVALPSGSENPTPTSLRLYFLRSSDDILSPDTRLTGNLRATNCSDTLLRSNRDRIYDRSRTSITLTKFCRILNMGEKSDITWARVSCELSDSKQCGSTGEKEIRTDGLELA